MTVTVISQSMYFPWIGLFDQIRLADEFIFYDDVQLTRGFYNRVQVAQANGTKFITVPLAKKKQKQLIQDTKISQKLLKIYFWNSIKGQHVLLFIIELIR